MSTKIAKTARRKGFHKSAIPKGGKIAGKIPKHGKDFGPINKPRDAKNPSKEITGTDYY